MTRTPTLLRRFVQWLVGAPPPVPLQERLSEKVAAVAADPCPARSARANAMQAAPSSGMSSRSPAILSESQ